MCCRPRRFGSDGVDNLPGSINRYVTFQLAGLHTGAKPVAGRKKEKQRKQAFHQFGFST